MGLRPGLYEQVVSRADAAELAGMPAELREVRAIDGAEAPEILSSYLAALARRKFEALTDEGADGLDEQVDLTNRLIGLLGEDARRVAPEKAQLLALMDAKDPLRVTGRTAADLPRPESPMSRSSIFTGGAVREPELLFELKKEIQTADRIDFLVSFIKWSGAVRILDELKAFTQSGKRLRVIATTYTGATDARAIEALRELPNTEIKISYETKTTRLHAKAYIFHRNTGFSTAYVGSSNLTNVAISSGLEWNFKVTQTDLPDTMEKIRASFESYWASPDFTPYTADCRERLEQALKSERFYGSGETRAYVFDIHPYSYQQEILDKLEAERTIRGRHKNLVVAATGTGKTVISAFDYRNYCKSHPGEANRLLFVAHREEILKQSRDTFRGVLKNANFGDLYVGNYKAENPDHLFISIQTLNSQSLWDKLPENYYDFMIVDEFHHAAASSYQRLLAYFKPRILLGLTATPERMDQKDITDYFDGHIAAEIRLPEAIDRKLLSPFQYFGVTDTEDLSGLTWSRGGYDRNQLSDLYVNNARRAQHIVDSVAYYCADLNRVKGLGFCVTKQHAHYMADFFNICGIPSLCLTGDSPNEERNSAKIRLVNGDLRFIFAVDIYNEGVDIPEVNTVLFLRPTESLTIFLQQLGRGLRLAEGKDCLTVLDFIGQANQHYNFEEKFRAMLSVPTGDMTDFVTRGFPFVPKGCFIQLEKVASEVILRNIRAHFRGKSALVARIAEFETETGQPLTLENFLNYSHLNPRKLYKTDYSFSRLCVEAGVRADFTEPLEEPLRTGIQRLATIDSRRWIDFLLDRFLEENPVEWDDCSPSEQRMIRMFCVTIWMKVPSDGEDAEYREQLRVLADSPVLRGELRELLAFQRERIDFVDEPVDPGFDCPLDLHCTYTRDQLLLALDWMNPATVREGVKYLPEKKLDILFVTLNKSLSDYSPTTLYKDYSVNDTLFHWQSQSTTSEDSKTGQRYQQGTSGVLLFVREFKKDEYGQTGAYTYLGKVHYESHTGSCPMNVLWRLERPIPTRFLRKTNKLLLS